MLFILFSSAELSIVLVAGLYAFVGLWWLMTHHWDGLVLQMAARTRRDTPLRGSVVMGTLAILLLAAGLGARWFDGTMTRLRFGLMPTSGGDMRGGVHARSGVGMGDQLISANDHATTFGPIETDLFMTSDQPSLYDTFSDMYGEPERVKRNRAIALDSKLGRESHHRMAVSKRASRAFRTVRRKPTRRHERADDLDSPALLFLSGPTPVHLRMETYDSFDGIDWAHTELDVSRPRFRCTAVDGEPWMRLERFDPHQVYRGKQTHVVKVINLRTSRIPSPAGLVAWHIDRVDRESFFGWTDDGVPELTAHETIPELTVIHEVSQSLKTAALKPPRSASKGRSRDPYLQLLDDRYASLARNWAGHGTRGLEQVERVIYRLRSTMTHDRRAVVPEDCHDVVGHFLKVGRGPDYLFATTAAVLLRNLGYPARVVSGFYADADNYDRVADQTIVRREDVHFWAEVRMAGGYWVPLEPTPGYAPPVPLLTWRKRLARVLTASLRSIWRSRYAALTAVLLALLMVVARRRVLDGIASSLWWMFFRGSLRQRVRCTWRLLEWRTRVAGMRRPGNVTLAQWYGRLLRSLPETRAYAATLISCGDWALYGHGATLTGVPAARVVEMCRRAARHCTARRLARQRTWSKRGRRAFRQLRGPRGKGRGGTT
jgi:hypothetical protein